MKDARHVSRFGNHPLLMIRKIHYHLYITPGKRGIILIQLCDMYQEAAFLILDQQVIFGINLVIAGIKRYGDRFNMIAAGFMGMCPCCFVTMICMMGTG